MSKSLFITATGTDIGKTYITALITKRLRTAGINAGYYKAALSGAEKLPDGSLLPGDAVFVAKTSGMTENPKNLVSYIYQEPLSPHLAAIRKGNPVNINKIYADYQTALSKYDYVTMEGSGGIICPIRWDKRHILLEDIIKELHLGVLVISNAILGSINNCVLTIVYLKQKNIPIRGIILNNYNDNDFMQCDNKHMIEELTNIPVLACVPPHAADINIDIDILKSLYN